MNGHLPAQPNTKIYVRRHLWEHRCTNCPAVTTTLLHSTSQGTITGGVCCNHLKDYLTKTIRSKCCGLGRTLVLLQHDSTRPLTAYQCVVTVATYCIPVCCYGITALGKILHTSMLLHHDSTRPHTAFQCVVTVAKYCIPVCCYIITALGHILQTSVFYSGHILHTSVLLQWPHTAYQCVVTA